MITDYERDRKSRRDRIRDLVLICSDGLTGMLSDDRILAIVSANAGSVQTACEQLVSEASAEGGRDNISVILIRYEA